VSRNYSGLPTYRRNAAAVAPPVPPEELAMAPPEPPLDPPTQTSDSHDSP